MGKQSKETPTAISVLLEWQHKDQIKQHGHRVEIIRAFKTVWDTKPSEFKFYQLTKRIVLFPEILYYMVNNPIPKRISMDMLARFNDTEDTRIMIKAIAGAHREAMKKKP